MGSTEAVGRERGPLVVLGLDAFEVDWLHRWSGEGHLPFLTALMKQGVFARVRCSSFADAPWPSMVSGVTPGGHGVYAHRQLRRGTYHVERIDARHCRRRPFWHRLRHSGLKFAVFDVPGTFPIAAVPGIQICGWGEHDPLLRAPESAPAEAVRDIEARFGKYPHPHEMTDATRMYEEACARTLLDNVDRKVAATEYLMGLGRWDFVFSVFSEVHYANHQFLHLVDENHWAWDANAPRGLRNALPGIAARLDAGLNRIYEQLPARANLIILSVHGIEPNFSGNAMVSEFLERLGVLVPAQQEEPSNALGSILLRTRRLREMLPQSVRDFINDRLPDNVHDQAVASAFAGKVDWKRTQVFPLPSDHFQAFLSLNLVGREPDGIVQPGSDAEMLFGRVRAEFMRLVNVDTGRPAVHDVQWIPSLYSGPAAFELPDIVVQWSKDEPIRKLRHPEMGVFEVPHRGLRRSQHTTRGFFLGIGPAFVEQASGPEIDTTDITPTLLHLLGQEPDPDLPGEVRLDLLRAGATPAPGGADMVSGTASTAGQP